MMVGFPLKSVENQILTLKICRKLAKRLKSCYLWEMYFLNMQQRWGLVICRVESWGLKSHVSRTGTELALSGSYPKGVKTFESWKLVILGQRLIVSALYVCVLAYYFLPLMHQTKRLYGWSGSWHPNQHKQQHWWEKILSWLQKQGFEEDGGYAQGLGRRN